MDLLIGIRKTGLQVSGESCYFPDLIKQIGGPEEKPVRLSDRNRALSDNRIGFLLGTALSAAICSIRSLSPPFS